MSEQAAISNSVTDSSAAALAAQQAATEAGEKLYAGKYKSVEELEKGYSELQKAFSSRTTETPAANEQTQQKPSTTIDPNAQAAVQNAGLDFDKLEAEYAEKGGLSDETYADLEKKGFPRVRVDRYIAGVVADNSAYDNAVFGTAGGEEQYGLMVQWAATALTGDEIAGFNAAVESKNINQAKLAVEGLLARYRAKNGSAPGLLNGSTSSGGGAQAFKSEAEVVQAMNSPKYRNDPAYRKEVLERLKVSEVFG